MKQTKLSYNIVTMLAKGTLKQFSEKLKYEDTL